MHKNLNCKNPRTSTCSVIYLSTIIILLAVARTLGIHLVGETEAGWGLQSPPSSDRAPRGCMHHHPTVRHSARFPQWILCSCHFTGERLWFYSVLVAGKLPNESFFFCTIFCYLGANVIRIFMIIRRILNYKG